MIPSHYRKSAKGQFVISTSLFVPIGVLLLELFAGGCSDDAKPPKRGVEGAEIFYSVYKVFDVVRCRNGRTTESEARRNIGREITITQTLFKRDCITGDVIIDNPVYKLISHPYPKGEGDVPNRRFSHYWGFGTERETIEIIEIYSRDDLDVPMYIFEIISDAELWDIYDGWLYKLKKE